MSTVYLIGVVPAMLGFAAGLTRLIQNDMYSPVIGMVALLLGACWPFSVLVVLMGWVAIQLGRAGARIARWLP